MARYNYIPTTYDSTLDMSLFPIVDVTTPADVLARPGQRTLVPDFLDQGWQELLNGIRFWTTATYAGQKWTTLCYVQQGTTSLWLFTLAFNALDSPMQLQPGMLLRFPLVSEVRRMLSANQNNNGIGQIVSIGPPNIIGGT
jgi:hypothetical protein